MTQIDAAWLAGLLDGEGYFCWDKGKDSHYGSPRVRLGMTDRDVVERAAGLMGAKSVRTHKPKGNRRPVFVCHVAGLKAHAVMVSVLPHMGARRTERIKSLVYRFETRPSRRRGQLCAGQSVVTEVTDE